MLKRGFTQSKTRFQGLFLVRTVPYEQFTDAFNILDEQIAGAYVNRWLAPDVIQGRLAVEDQAEIPAKYTILQESIGTLSVGAVTDITATGLNVFAGNRLRLQLGGAGINDLLKERWRVEQATQHYMSSSIYTAIGSFSISDLNAFQESIDGALKTMTEALPEHIEMSELAVLKH